MGATGPAAPPEDSALVEPDLPPPAPPPAVASSNGAAQAEALSALQNLGYAPGEAASAVATALGEDPAADTTTLIRAALKLLAPKD